VALYAAFLRAINVGGHRVEKGELVAIFEALGMEDVTTFRASGNVIFGSPRKPSVERIEDALEEKLGYAAPVYLRSAKELLAIAATTPFPAKAVDASNGKLQVVLLKSKPSAAARKKVLSLATDQDRLAWGERELYWLPSGGLMDSELDQKAVTAAVGPTTTRTKGTMDLIAAKWFSA
jgi:uncharacterized protein (DUF1697 family)